MSRPKISYDEYDKIIELYNSGLSTIKISTIYNTCHSVIRKILLKCGITLRDDSHKGRKYTINEFYFDNIDTANKSYILGLLYADGCNYPPQRRVKIELQEQDKDILDCINKEIDSNKPLYLIPLHDKNPNWQNTYRLDIINKHISDVLVDKGVVQNKSLILKPPTFIMNGFIRDFIRGYFDGDGSVSTAGPNAIRFQICAHKPEVLKTIVDFFFEEYNIPKVAIQKQKKDSGNYLYYFQYSTKATRQIFEILYPLDCLYLPRKYEKFKSII